MVCDFWWRRVWGGRNIYDLWPILRDSPILTGFGSSPLVLLAFEANKHLIGLSPSPFLSHLLPPSSSNSLSSNNPFYASQIHEPLSYSPANYPSYALAAARQEEYRPIEGLLVLHIRRGDFEEHCRNLAGWGVPWQGFNMMAQEGMRDGLGVLRPEPESEEAHEEGDEVIGDGEGKSESESERVDDVVDPVVHQGESAEDQAVSRRAPPQVQDGRGRRPQNMLPSNTLPLPPYTGPLLGTPPYLPDSSTRESNYFSRCYPSIEDIVKRVRDVRKEYPRLKRVYVMTNGPGEWVRELKEELMRDSERHKESFVQDEVGWERQ